MNELEKQFYTARGVVQERIEEEINKANDALDRVKILADTVGIPVDVYLNIFDKLHQYVPESFKQKFAALDFVVTGVAYAKESAEEDWDPSEYEEEDWSYSSSCEWQDSGC